MSITDRDSLIAAYAAGRSFPISQMNISGSLSVTGSSAGMFMSNSVSGRIGPPYVSAGGTPYVCTSATPGCPVPYPAPAAGKNWYLGAISLSDASNGSGMAIILDRLAQVQLYPTAITNATMSMTRPARSTSAVGVYAFVEITSSTGNYTTNNGITITYTNHAGVSGRTASVSINNLTPASVNSFVRFPLQAGDRGISSIEKVVTTTFWNQQTAFVVLAKPVHVVGYGHGMTPAAHGFMDIGTPLLGADSYLMMACPGTSQRYIDGTIRLIQA